MTVYIHVPGELLLLNGFGLTTSMFLACFSGSSKCTVTVGSQELAADKLLLNVSEEGASLHLIYLCTFSFTAFSVPGLQFYVSSHLLVLGFLSSLDN